MLSFKKTHQILGKLLGRRETQRHKHDGIGSSFRFKASTFRISGVYDKQWSPKRFPRRSDISLITTPGECLDPVQCSDFPAIILALRFILFRKQKSTPRNTYKADGTPHTQSRTVVGTNRRAPDPLEVNVKELRKVGRVAEKEGHAIGLLPLLQSGSTS
jgi:hypothetical protein